MNQINRPEAEAETASSSRPRSPHDKPAAEAPVRPAAKPDPQADSRRGRIARLTALAAVILVAAMVAWGTWAHMARRSAAHTALQTRQDAIPTVKTQVVHANDRAEVVDLPGTMQAFDAATLYARATGYIARRNVDIGSHVHRGDVLAIIAAPDLDQQLAQARAQLVQMEASLQQAVASRRLAKVTNQRTSRLVSEGWDSRQQGDRDSTTLSTQSAGVGVAQANVAAQVAQVNRLVELTGFERVVAPFDGVITARSIDAGNLVTADAASGTSLFSLARTAVLRVQVYVPQEHFFSLKDGQDTTITIPQLPGRTFHGRVARNAAALATDTRTLLAEVDVDNRDNALSAGLYGIVHLQVPRAQPVIALPSQAVIFNKDGLSAAVVEDGRIALRHLDVAEDDGAQVQVRAGLKEGDRVILSLPVDLNAGMKVKAN